VRSTGNSGTIADPTSTFPSFAIALRRELRCATPRALCSKNESSHFMDAHL
jgi:hypothetical protein